MKRFTGKLFCCTELMHCNCKNLHAKRLNVMTVSLKKKDLNPLPKLLSSFRSLFTGKMTISGTGIFCGPVSGSFAVLG